MKTIHFIFAFLLSLLPAYAADSLTNPNDLVPPIMLTRASYIRTLPSFSGTLRDSRGQHLYFSFGRILPSTTDKLYIAGDSGHGKDSMRPRIKAQRAADLYRLLERTIRQQFVWDASAGKLRPKDPKQQSFNEPSALMGVTVILAHVERALHRDETFMQ